MSSELWVGAATTLSGTVLGGAITFVLSRQQMKDARLQRLEQDARETHRRGLDRRYDAYADFYTKARTFRNALRHGQQPAPQLPPTEISALARPAHEASALVFLVVQSRKTSKACRDVVAAMSEIQGAIDDGSDPVGKPWPDLNERMAGVLRDFQIAAREELEVRWT